MRRSFVLALLALLAAAACASDDPLPSAGNANGSANGNAELSPIGAECQWPMFGRDPSRTFRACDTSITTANIAELRQIWFTKTDDVVSASPVIVDGRLYVGDWAGVFYSIDAETGEILWRTQLRVNPQQYGGQISASATHVRDPDGDRVIVASGDTVYALDPDDGTARWSTRVTDDEFGEVLGSPLVIGDLVIVGFDAHGAAFDSGVLALDRRTGDRVWYFDPEVGARNGCGGVWGSPTVDVARGLVFAGTANCPPSRGGWNDYSEALVALDAETGTPVWSFQPHEENDRDTDFAGAPNLLVTADGRELVGLGSKDAHYYAVDRDDGELVWETEATEEGFIRPDFASGGFIGPSAVGDGIVIGTTGVGDCPCVHAMDTSTGEIVWQQLAVGPSYAPTTIVGDLAFVASIDTTLRALATDTGEVVWSSTLGVLASGGIAAVGDDLWAVAGFREPGSPGPSERSGVFRFSVDPAAVPATPPTTTVVADTPEDAAVELEGSESRCVESACAFTFSFKDPPAGTEPAAQLSLTTEPFSVTITASDLGDPDEWLRAGSEAADVGAVAYGVMISERDDEPNGGFLCILDDELSCTGRSVPRPGASYSRISILALADIDVVPDTADGFSRLVDPIAFVPPLQTVLRSAPGGDAAPGTVALSGQGNDLVAYDVEGNRQVVIRNAADDPVDGRDINAQICFLDERTFIAGEDTGQPERPPGWGIFVLEGTRIGELDATQVGKLIPTYQPAESQPEMFGCGVLPDGRVVLTDVGNQALGPGTGQLMMFFPPVPGDPASYTGEIVEHCKLDTSIATAQQIAIDGDDVLVASARPPTVGVTRYSNLPASLDECDQPVEKELVIDPADGDLGITNGIVRSPEGWYVSSVFTGVINEYDLNGSFVREILRPPEGESFGAQPFSTGSPNGLGVTADGTLWYADLGLVVRDGGGIGPGRELGTVRVIRFVDGVPQPPRIIDDGLQFPDAIGVIP